MRWPQPRDEILVGPALSLDDPARGATGVSLGSLKTALDDVQQRLHRHARVEHLDHVLDAKPGSLACLSESFDGSN